MARLDPLQPPFAPAVAAELAQMPADLALFRTVAHNPRVLSRWRGGGLLDKGSITLRQRELIILRTTARLKAEYEWGVHVAYFKAKAGFSDTEIAATLHSGATSGWSAEESVLIEMTDALVLAVHGVFDGASAWALRVAMEESEAPRCVVDLTHAVEAFEFAASILATFVRQSRQTKRVTFLPGTPEHARLLAGFGLEVVEDEAAADVPVAVSSR